MQNPLASRDTAHLRQNEVLPAVLNEDAFWPSEPRSLEEAGVSEMFIESLLSQILLGVGTMSGRKLSERTGLPFGIIEPQLAQLRVRQLVAHARPAPLNDFYYSLTDAGQRRALGHQKVCSYSGPAPVPLLDYVLSVEAQASHFDPITRKQLVEALSEITYDPSWLDFIGPAVNSNNGIFLYGPPGNGKTTLAKCLTACRGQEIWIPHAIIDDGVIIKIYDASYHQSAPVMASQKSIMAVQEHDRRWIRVKRPTVVVGGELTLDNLEIRHDPRSNTCEAPLQLKSNCGCLLIDDFGRQRVAPAELLNRWIVPLENRIDYLTLPTGKKISVPFEQIILFSTNLQPEELVDEAFMRRVPFKIEIDNPPQAEFLELFRLGCKALDVMFREDTVQYLIEKYYRKTGRPFRRCHPRDLLLQIRCLAAYRGERPELRNDLIDLACRNYFGSGGLPGDVLPSSDALNAGYTPAAASGESSNERPVGWQPPKNYTRPVTPIPVVGSQAMQSGRDRNAATPITPPASPTSSAAPKLQNALSQSVSRTMNIQGIASEPADSPVSQPIDGTVAIPNVQAPVLPKPTFAVPKP